MIPFVQAVLRVELSQLGLKLALVEELTLHLEAGGVDADARHPDGLSHAEIPEVVDWLLKEFRGYWNDHLYPQDPGLLHVGMFFHVERHGPDPDCVHPVVK